MKKVLKKIMSFALAAATAATVSISAAASGTLEQTYGMQNNTPYYSCAYDVDGNLNLTGHGKNAGAMENNAFYVTNNGSYELKYTPTTAHPATLKIWRAGDFPNNGNPVYTLTIPRSGGGMPSSFITSISLSTGYYDVEIISNELGKYATGSFTIYGVLQRKQG